MRKNKFTELTLLSKYNLLKTNNVMMKNLFLFIFSLFTLTVSAQVKNQDPLAGMINSTLMHQVMNDFDRSIPIAFFAPGFYFIGSIDSQSNPLFNEGDFYENEELVKSSSYYQKEVFDALSSGLISYIPADSTMQVRVIDGKKLLFELKFVTNSDTISFTQTDAERGKSKSVSYSGSKVLAVSYNDTGKEINFISRLIGDSLRVSEMNDKNPGKSFRTEIRYKNGFLSETSWYNKVSGVYELKSTDHYYLNEINKPGLMQTLNRKGMVTDSTNYYYNGDKLVHYQSFSGANEKLSVTYIYNRAGKLAGKTVKSPARNYSVDYSYAGGNIADIEIDDKIKAFVRHYVFKMDVNKRLANVEYNTIARESLVENLKTRWIFSYNTAGNISSVKVLDGKGNITKEIAIEYVFYSN
ncbi:MAG: hypothetical protein IPH20_27085 [Bacteroidales bacterium]|nr:hypothetical protein [Bacteroidales bacterium]